MPASCGLKTSTRLRLTISGLSCNSTQPMARVGAVLVRLKGCQFGDMEKLIEICLGHCYLMMDELQQAYTAYQSALYNLRDPKVILHSTMLISITQINNRSRNPSCGMALASYTTDMDLWTTQRRHFVKLCVWLLNSTRQMRYIFVWA